MARRHRVYRQIEGKKRYEHRAKTLVSVAVLIILLAFPISVYKARMAPIIEDPSAMDAAQVARNLARGGGYTTNIIRPSLYSALPRFTKPADIVNPPLHVWLLALLPGMRKGTALVTPDSTVANLSTFFYLATALLVFLLERRMSGNKSFAMAALICLFCVPLLQAAVSGTGEAIGIAMVTLLLTMVCVDKNQSFLYSFLIGAVVGLCYLASYVFLTLLIPVAALKASRGGEKLVRHLIAAAVGLVAMVTPWMIRNIYFGGNALLAQPFSAVFLGSAQAAGCPGLAGKLFLQFTSLYASIISKYGGVFALVFFILSPLVRSEGRENQEAKAFLWGGIGLVFFFSVLGKGADTALAAFVPGAIILGCRTFVDIMPVHGGEPAITRSRMLAVFVALNLLPFAMAMVAATPSGWSLGKHEARLRSMADMRSLMHVGEIVMTNAPEWMAYYGEFNTLPIPESENELKKWEGEFGQLRFAAVCPYGVRGPVETMILQQHVVPSWFINEKSYIYPSGEYFFASADAEDFTAVPR